MVQRIGGFRRKTRHKFSKHFKDKGKISIRRFLQELKEGEKVLLDAEPAYQKGMYFPRFHSKLAVVKGKRGECYEVQIKDGGNKKTLIVHPVHLRKL